MFFLLVSIFSHYIYYSLTISDYKFGIYLYTLSKNLIQQRYHINKYLSN